MALQEPMGVTHNVVLLPFGTISVANADGTLYTSPIPTLTGYAMLNKGSVIGIQGTISAALTTGTITPRVTINGSLCPAFPDAATLRTNQMVGKYKQESGKPNFIFNEGDTIGLMYNKAGTINPTTRDVSFQLVVLLEDYRF